MSFPLVTADAQLSVEVAVDKIQNKVRHLLVVEDDEINKSLGIITSTDFEAFLKEDTNGVNTRKARREEHEVIKELEEQGQIPKDVLRGEERYENEEPRQVLHR